MPFDSNQIKAFRKKLKLTQAELGKLLGVPQSTVGRWEAELTVPNAKHIGLMCDLGYAYGVQPSFFFPNFSRLENQGDANE
ncbi:MAG: helix-turn-helix transcriptional regulator [Chloroflexi bacterium]|nr:helix-turn-helix transcriptional regulator [Chloroflexota bacterium]